MIKKIICFIPDITVIFVSLCLLLVFKILDQSGVPVTTIVLFLLLFVPGYLILGILYPTKCICLKMDLIFSSAGLSVVFSSLLFLILGYSVGITFETVLLTLTFFIIIASIFLAVRRINSAITHFPFFLNTKKDFFSKVDWLRSLGVFIVLLSLVIVIISKQENSKNFTEFYVLGDNQKAGSYGNFEVERDETKLFFGVISHERSPEEYRVVQQESLGSSKLLKEFTLNPNETLEWESTLSHLDFPPGSKVSFDLYKGNQTEPYRSLYLWLEE